MIDRTIKNKATPLENKTCSKCSKSKPLDQFHKQSATKDGHQSQCIACVKEYHRARGAGELERKRVDVKQWKADREAGIPYTDKECTACSETKPLDAFGKLARSYDGLTAQCSECKNRINRELAEARAAAREAAGYTPPEGKDCTLCGRWWPIEFYYVSPLTKDGYYQRCKECCVELASDYAKENAERYDAGLTVIPDSKECSSCGETKSSSDFSVNKSRPDGLHYRCSECDSLAQRVERANDLEHHREIDSLWAAANVERSKKTRRKHELKKRYKMTPEEFATRLAEQGWCCALCRRDNPGVRDWSVDHDHACCPGENTCGECVAGILCGRCNVAIGFLCDDPELAQAAEEYLRRTRNRKGT